MSYIAALTGLLFVVGIPVGAFVAARRSGPVKASKGAPLSPPNTSRAALAWARVHRQLRAAPSGTA